MKFGIFDHVDDSGLPLAEHLEARLQMVAAFELKQDHGPFGKDQGVSHGVVQGPDLHVGAVQRIADIDRVIKQSRSTIVLAQKLADARQAVDAGAAQHLMRDGADQGLVAALGVQIGQFAVVFERCLDHPRAPAKAPCIRRL